MALMGGRPSSFVALQRLKRSFDDVRTRRAVGERRKQSLARLAVDLGACAVPLLERRLLGGTDEEALWSFELLLLLAEEPDHLPRVTRAFERAATEDGASETARMLAIGLLAQLDQDLPEGARNQDVDAVHRASVEELARHLDSPAAIARAADHLVHHLTPIELVELVDSLCVVEGPRAGRLVDELLARDDVHEQVRSEIGRRSALIRGCPEAAWQPRPIDRRRRPPATCLLSRPGANLVVIASQRVPGSRPVRHRALCCALSADGLVVDAMYRDDFTPAGLEREVIRPLVGDGFGRHELGADEIGDLLAQAANATHRAGRKLPRGYFLGRDILGLFDDHMTSRQRRLAGDYVGQLLARSIDLLSIGEHEAARALLERYRQLAPHDAEGASALGSSLLALGRNEEALRELRRAAEIEPAGAPHHWNLAAACHKLGDADGCYLALCDFQRARDATVPEEQAEHARAFIAAYERRARLESPEQEPATFARAKQRARAAAERARARSRKRAAARRSKRNWVTTEQGTGNRE